MNLTERVGSAFRYGYNHPYPAKPVLVILAQWA